MRLATSDLDLSLAVKRVKRDIRDDWFVDPLRYGDILSKRQFDRWVKDADGFGRTEEFNIPKEGFVVRAASEMFIHERVLYQAIVDLLIEEYDALLRPCIFSHRLRPGHEDFIFLNALLIPMVHGRCPAQLGLAAALLFLACVFGWRSWVFYGHMGQAIFGHYLVALEREKRRTTKAEEGDEPNEETHPPKQG